MIVEPDDIQAYVDVVTYLSSVGNRVGRDGGVDVWETTNYAVRLELDGKMYVWPMAYSGVGPDRWDFSWRHPCSVDRLRHILEPFDSGGEAYEDGVPVELPGMWDESDLRGGWTDNELDTVSSRAVNFGEAGDPPREGATIMNNAMVQAAADAILDYLIDAPDHTFKAPYGRVLVGLANIAFQGDFRVGDVEYHAVSRAVIMLEDLELVIVTRLYARNKAKANVLAAVRLKEDQ